MSEEREKKVIRLFHLQGYDKMVDQLFEMLIKKAEEEGLDQEDRDEIFQYADDVKQESFDLGVELISEFYTDDEIDFLFETATHPIQKSIRAKTPMVMMRLMTRLSEVMEEKNIEFGLEDSEWDDK